MIKSNMHSKNPIKEIKNTYKNKYIKTKKSLEELQEQCMLVSEKALIGIYIIQDYKFTYVNKPLSNIFGYSPNEMIGKKVLDFIDEESKIQVKNNIYERLSKKKGNINYQIKGITKDNEKIDIEANGSYFFYEGKDSIIGTLKDNTQKEEAKIQLDLASKVFENSSEGIIITDENCNIIWANPSVSYITGFDIDELLGENPSLFKSNRHDDKFYEEMWESLITKGIWQGKIWNRRKNGEAYPEWLVITSLKDKNGEVIRYISVFNELDSFNGDNNKKEKNHFDFLTNLPNRFLFNDRFESALKHARKNDTQVSLMFIDIDKFKRVNDGLGYEVGDDLLKAVSERINKTLGEQHTVSRISGDEFMVFVSNISDVDEVLNIAHGISNSFNNPFEVNGHDIFMTVSIGISIYPYDGKEINTLVKNAETAMNRAKDISGNRYELYKHRMNSSSINKLMLENDMRRGIEKNEFELYYQPKINIKNSNIEGLEALIRWNHPIKGMVPPNDFIPVAEETGLIVDIGEWVLKEALLQQSKWQNESLYFGPISINLSAKQFKMQNLEEDILKTIDELNISHSSLDLEITETVAMESAEYTLKLMESLKEKGITFSIDDFGTGYSSLSYLKEFPCSALKIDKSFIDDIEKNDGFSIIRGIVAMAHSIKLKVVAEGVETKKQLQRLKDIDCDLVQGYYFTPPIPDYEVERFYKEYSLNSKLV